MTISEDNETIWHVVSIEQDSLYNNVYFQFNSTNFSIIGSKHISTWDLDRFGVGIEAAEGIV